MKPPERMSSPCSLNCLPPKSVSHVSCHGPGRSRTSVQARASNDPSASHDVYNSPLKALSRMEGRSAASSAAVSDCNFFSASTLDCKPSR